MPPATVNDGESEPAKLDVNGKELVNLKRAHRNGVFGGKATALVKFTGVLVHRICLDE